MADFWTGAYPPSPNPVAMPGQAPGANRMKPNASDTVKKLANSSAKVPGWLIAGAGALGYVLSDTQIIGPFYSVILIVASLAQLGYYTTQRLRQGKTGLINA